MCHVIRKPVFRFCDQVWLKPACYSIEILDKASVCIKLSKQQTAKTLITLCGCADWSASLLSAYSIKHVFSWRGSNLTTDTWFEGCVWILQILMDSKLRHMGKQTNRELDSCIAHATAGQTIRIFSGCEMQIKNSDMRVTVRHHKASRGMPNGYPQWQTFQFAPNHYWFFFLHTRSSTIVFV